MTAHCYTLNIKVELRLQSDLASQFQDTVLILIFYNYFNL